MLACFSSWGQEISDLPLYGKESVAVSKDWLVEDIQQKQRFTEMRTGAW